jgi:hypothetical protein
LTVTRQTIGKRLTAAWVFAFVVLAAPTELSAQMLYAVDGGGMATSSHLYTINPSNGAVLSTVGTVMLSGSAVPVSGLSFAPTGGVLFGTTNQGASTKLVTIDPATAVATTVGTVGLSFQGFGFSPTGVLYGYSKAGITGNPSFPSESLYTINPSTAAATLVGSSGFSNTQGDGMAVSSSGTIFFSGNQSSGQLSTLSPTTGTASTFANLTGGPSPAAPIKGLSFDGSGNLVGIFNGSTVDLLEIGTVPVGGSVSITDLGAISPSTPSPLTALAFQPVPEPGSLALLGSAAVAGGWLARRRRKGPRDSTIW